MLNILIASEDAERLAEISRMVAACGSYRIMRLQDAPANLPMHAAQLRSADGLVIDQPLGGSTQMLGIEMLRLQHPDLPCILVSQVHQSDVLIRALRAGVSDVLAWPLERGQLSDALRRLESSHTPRTREEAKIISFISSKGGAGVSFIASNLGHVLGTNEHKRVLLIDLNTQFSDTHFILSDKDPPATLSEVCAQIDRLDDAFLDACLTHVEGSFDILAGPRDPIRASEIKKEKIEYILSLVAGNYDYVLIDIGQAISQLSIPVLDRSDTIFVVTQPSIAHARTGRRLLDILHGLHYRDEKIRILLNRSGSRDELTRAKLENVFGAKICHTLPDDPVAVDTSISHGVPLLRENKRSAMCKSLLALSESFTAQGGEHRAAQERSFALSRFFPKAKPSSPNVA